MNINGIGVHIIVILVFVMTFSLESFSQRDTVSIPVREVPGKADTTAGSHSLYAGIGGGSNMIYLGSSISNNKPFYSGSVIYGFRNALFASVSATHLNETVPYVAFYNVALNYSHTVNSWFDISANIAGYKTAESLHDSLFSDFVYINLTTGFDWKLIYTRLFFSGLFSEERGFYLQVSNSRYFETGEFLKGKALVYFNPDIDILLGKLITVENASGNKMNGKAPPFSHARKKPGNPSEILSEKFGFLDIMFSLPVTFSYGKVSVEAQPSYLLPLYTNQYYAEPEGFTFYLNIIFKVF